jgi:hypothetical protein
MKVFILVTIALVILFAIYKIFTGQKPVEYRAIIQPLKPAPKPVQPVRPPPVVIVPSTATKPNGQPGWVPKPVIIQPLQPMKKL